MPAARSGRYASFAADVTDCGEAQRATTLPITRMTTAATSRGKNVVAQVRQHPPVDRDAAGSASDSSDSSDCLRSILPRSPRFPLQAPSGAALIVAHKRWSRELAQRTVPVMIANTKAIVAIHRMSPATVPRLAEIVESTLVNMIGLLPSCHLATNAAAPVRLSLGVEALMRISSRVKDRGRSLCTIPRPKNDTLERRENAVGAGPLPARAGLSGVLNLGRRAGFASSWATLIATASQPAGPDDP